MKLRYLTPAIDEFCFKWKVHSIAGADVLVACASEVLDYFV